MALREAGFVDSFRVLHPEAETVGTFSGFRELGKAKIDYVLLRGAVGRARGGDRRGAPRWDDGLRITRPSRRRCDCAEPGAALRVSWRVAMIAAPNRELFARRTH